MRLCCRDTTCLCCRDTMCVCCRDTTCLCCRDTMGHCCPCGCAESRAKRRMPACPPPTLPHAFPSLPSPTLRHGQRPAAQKTISQPPSRKLFLDRPASRRPGLRRPGLRPGLRASQTLFLDRPASRRPGRAARKLFLDWPGVVGGWLWCVTCENKSRASRGK